MGRRIDLVGRVVYTDCTPYSGGIIELHRTALYPTDSEGFYVY